MNVIENRTKSNPEIIKTNQKEIINILRTAFEQSDLQLNQQNYRQTKGLAIVALTSAILAIVCFQYMEHKELYPSLLKCQII
jgi:hypothetical protein